MNMLKGKIILFLLLFAVWLLLTLPAGGSELIAGCAVAFLAAAIPWGKTMILHEVRLNPKSVFFMAVYIFVFLKVLVLSNIDVALRVVSPKLPSNSGIVRVKTKLKSRLGRLILANSITLTPGTITVETDEDDFFIHWIDVEGESIEDRTKKIVAGFEKYLEVIVG